MGRLFASSSPSLSSTYTNIVNVRLKPMQGSTFFLSIHCPGQVICLLVDTLSIKQSVLYVSHMIFGMLYDYLLCLYMS